MGRGEGYERELKFADVDLNQLKVRLVELDAERQGAPTLEDNFIFDKNGELDSAGSLLRLRLDGRGARMTFKGPATFDGMAKVRREIETGVDDVEKMRALIEALGYSLVRRYQKKREEWFLGAIVIALDHTPIGDFVEFEGEGCETVAKRCGLDPKKAERRNYLRLYEDYLQENPESPPDMVFRG
jgi:predicted adenylyl cyclase CyaB